MTNPEREAEPIELLLHPALYFSPHLVVSEARYLMRMQSDIIGQLIQELRDDIEKVNHAIAALEQLRCIPTLTAGTGAQKRRPGRKSMTPEERKEVSARMMAYWARRRQKH